MSVSTRAAIGGVVVALALTPALALAAPGNRVTDYGTDGEAPVEWITSEVGIVGLVGAPDGRLILNVAADPQVSVFSLVSADGTEVTTVALPGPGEATFGPGTSVFAAYGPADATSLAKYDQAGAVDESFGSGGTVALPTPPFAFPSALIAERSDIVIGGGTLDQDALDAWLVRIDATGAVDSAFGGDGVVEVIETAAPAANFIMVVDVHLMDDGYLVVVLTRGIGGDGVTVVPVARDGTIGSLSEYSFGDELVAVASTQMPDGAVIVGIQSTAGDVDTFHLHRFGSDGDPDATFANPAFTADEVGGRILLTGLRTGEVALGMNLGADETYVIELFSRSGAHFGRLPIPAGLRAGTWMYGMAAVWHDGGLLVAVDPVASDSVVPDQVNIAKFVADESGRFLDDDSSVHEHDIETLAAARITFGCNPPANTRYCPNDPLIRGQMAAFLTRALDLPAATVDHFTDDDGSIYENDIDRLAEAGITFGCNPPANTRYCPNDPLTRAQMATMILRAFPLEG